MATIIATVAIDTATATALNVGRAAGQSASSFEQLSRIGREREAEEIAIGLEKRMTAMPAMNPTVTGKG